MSLVPAERTLTLNEVATLINECLQQKARSAPDTDAKKFLLSSNLSAVSGSFATPPSSGSQTMGMYLTKSHRLTGPGSIKKSMKPGSLKINNIILRPGIIDACRMSHSAMKPDAATSFVNAEITDSNTTMREFLYSLAYKTFPKREEIEDGYYYVFEDANGKRLEREDFKYGIFFDGVIVQPTTYTRLLDLPFVVESTNTKTAKPVNITCYVELEDLHTIRSYLKKTSESEDNLIEDMFYRGGGGVKKKKAKKQLSSFAVDVHDENVNVLNRPVTKAASSKHTAQAASRKVDGETTEKEALDSSTLSELSTLKFSETQNEADDDWKDPQAEKIQQEPVKIHEYDCGTKAFNCTRVTGVQLPSDFNRYTVGVLGNHQSGKRYWGGDGKVPGFSYAFGMKVCRQVKDSAYYQRELKQASLCCRLAHKWNTTVNNTSGATFTVGKKLLLEYALDFCWGQCFPYWILEPHLHSFETYNLSNGYIPGRDSVKNKQTWEVAQAFSHWTYEYSKRELMVLNVEGGTVGSETFFTNLVPVFHTSGDFPHGRYYPDTEDGNAKIKRFTLRHECNKFCNMANLGSLLKFDESTPVSPVKSTPVSPVQSVTSSVTARRLGAVHTHSFTTDASASSRAGRKREIPKKLQDGASDEMLLACDKQSRTKEKKKK
jgi:hypothetical protein